MGKLRCLSGQRVWRRNSKPVCLTLGLVFSLQLREAQEGPADPCFSQDSMGLFLVGLAPGSFPCQVYGELAGGILRSLPSQQCLVSA